MNKVILAGRLARDPEVRYTQSGKAVASFSLAVNRRVGRGQEPQADFIPIVAWEKTAEVVGQYLAKGSQVLVEGRMQIRSYEAQDGSKRSAFDIVADEVEFLSANQNGGAPSGDYHAAPAAAPAPRTQAPAYAPADAGFTSVQVDDDELPF